MVDPSSLWMVKDKNNNDHCDFRLTSYNCAEGDFFKKMNITNAIMMLFILLVGIPLLYYRLFYLGQRLYEINHFTKLIKIKPKPIESMLFFGIIFNLLRMFNAIVIATDIFPNIVFRSFLFEFPWAFGYGAFASYVFGIVQTMNESCHVAHTTWFQDHFKINIVCVLMIIMPFLTNNIVSITAGVYEQNGNTEMAILYTRLLYYIWTVYCGLLAIILITCGTQLTRLLQQNLKLQQGYPTNITKIKAGMFKIKLVTIVGTICLALFSILVLIYALFRKELADYTSVYYFMLLSWTFDGTITSCLVVLTVIINPYTSGVIGNITGFNSTTHTTTLGGGEFSQNWNQESTLIWNNNSNLDKKRKSLCSMNMDLITTKSFNNNTNNNNHSPSNMTTPSQRKLRSSSISSGKDNSSYASISLDTISPSHTSNDLTTTTTIQRPIGPMEIIELDELQKQNNDMKNSNHSTELNQSRHNSMDHHFITY
ncbi:hypothetical protein BJ944DRAFT_284774 [Cunninghamella echinulata]|nr:hypothetical protein BJ944DRAFT_284774 [Cunninghamella echinulata]